MTHLGLFPIAFSLREAAIFIEDTLLQLANIRHLTMITISIFNSKSNHCWYIDNTVEPLYYGHFGTRYFWPLFGAI